MRFLHLSDLHIGRSLGEFDLIEDQRFILDQILEIAGQQKADCVMIAGDIYDRSVPGEEAVKLFDHFICRLAEMKIRTFIISGNHDSDERLNFGSRLFETSGICISSKYEGRLCRYQLEDGYGRVQVYLLPFVKASQVRHYFPEEKIELYEDAVRVVLENADIDPAERNILVAHQFVTGKGKDPVMGGSEGAAVLNVGLVEKISADCFDAFDYVALGHIHSPQRVGREEVRYSGSPLKYSLSEVKSEKTVPVVTLKQKGEVEIQYVSLRPRRDIRHLKGRMEQLLDRKNIKSPDDLIYVTLTDEEVINDAMGIFQQYYPNTVKIDYDNRHTKEIGQADIAAAADPRSFPELISELYSLMYGCEMSEEELAEIKDAAREAGVLDEADQISR